MLQNIRDFGNRKIVRLIFAMFLIIPFGLFGIDYYFKAPVGGDTVATVGSFRIGQSEFDNAVRRQADQYRQQFGAQFDAALMENPEVRRGVLDRLVNERLVALGAQGAGVRVGDKTMLERIQSEPVFHDASGKFSTERYEQVARSMGLTRVGLDERLREDFRQQAFRDAIAETAFIPRSTIDSFIRLSEQTREVSVVTLTPESYLPKVKVSPEQVQAYYESHKSEFTIPEQVRAEYIELSPETLAGQTEVNADEVKRVYEEGLKTGRWGQREERRASHILIEVKADAKDADKKAAEAKAKAIAEQVRKKPASFAELAKKESADAGSAAQGGDLGFVARGSMVKAFDESMFAAKKGEIVGPVQTEFGYHVIQLVDVRPEKVKTFAEASPEIEAELRKSAAARRLTELAENFTNIVYEQPSSLKPASDLTKLPVQSTGWFGKQFGAPPALGNPKLLGELFSDEALKAKRNTSAVEVRPNALVAARVLEHKPAVVRPLESVQADIQRRLQREEALKLAQAEGQAKLADAQAGKDPGVAFPPPLAVNRQKPGGLVPQVMDPIFRADAKKLPAYVGVSTPAGYSLVRVTKVIEVDKIDDAKREALASQLRSVVAARELEASLASIRNRAGVSVKKELIEQKKEEATPAPKGTETPKRPGPPTKF